MNKAFLSGYLTKDPECKNTSNGIEVCTFTLAVRRSVKSADGSTQSDFLNVVCWRKTAELAHQYLIKGSRCTVMGSIQSRSYDAQDGTKRYVTEIIADSLEFDPPKRQEPCYQKPQGSQTSFGQPDDDGDELPF